MSAPRKPPPPPQAHSDLSQNVPILKQDEGKNLISSDVVSEHLPPPLLPMQDTPQTSNETAKSSPVPSTPSPPTTRPSRKPPKPPVLPKEPDEAPPLPPTDISMSGLKSPDEPMDEKVSEKDNLDKKQNKVKLETDVNTFAPVTKPKPTPAPSSLSEKEKDTVTQEFKSTVNTTLANNTTPAKEIPGIDGSKVVRKPAPPPTIQKPLPPGKPRPPTTRPTRPITKSLPSLSQSQEQPMKEDECLSKQHEGEVHREPAPLKKPSPGGPLPTNKTSSEVKNFNQSATVPEPVDRGSTMAEDKVVGVPASLSKENKIPISDGTSFTSARAVRKPPPPPQPKLSKSVSVKQSTLPSSNNHENNGSLPSEERSEQPAEIASVPISIYFIFLVCTIMIANFLYYCIVYSKYKRKQKDFKD